MFCKTGILFRSDLMDAVPARILHGFSTREGGVSTAPHLASMNTAPGHGDTDENIRENIGILARTVSGGALDASAVICTKQIHSALIRRVGLRDAGSGVITPQGEDGDGFLTDEAGVLVMVRVADCVPILFAGIRDDGSPVVCAVHAGWRGTAAGIAPRAVEMLRGEGVSLSSIRCAVGPSIHRCCYEVGEDFVESVAALRGQAFAEAHIRPAGGHLAADLQGMNRALLTEAGLTETQIDIAPQCTACDPLLFHSHRASHGLRGAMAAMIGIG